VDCPQPKGACCFPDGSCAVLSEAECAGSGITIGNRRTPMGIYQGDGTTCETVECPQPPGACCLEDHCFVASRQECQATDGAWLGPGTDCDDCTRRLGACCLGDGTCTTSMTTGDAECLAAGGVYAGDDTDCGAVVCPQGACCIADETCQVELVADCLALGGSFVGEGTICTVDCASGACCVPDGSCFFVAPDVCDALGGDYEGGGILCEAVECP